VIVTRKKINPCLPEDGHAWGQLKDGVEYRVIGISYDMYRIQTTSNGWKPCLYHAKLFHVISATVEPEWIVDLGFDVDGVQNLDIGFPEFQSPGFWEKIHDDRPDALSILIPIFDRLGLKYS
jgi:hypothetical protein